MSVSNSGYKDYDDIPLEFIPKAPCKTEAVASIDLHNSTIPLFIADLHERLESDGGVSDPKLRAKYIQCFMEAVATQQRDTPDTKSLPSCLSLDSICPSNLEKVKSIAINQGAPSDAIGPATESLEMIDSVDLSEYVDIPEMDEEAHQHQQCVEGLPPATKESVCNLLEEAIPVQETSMYLITPMDCFYGM